MPIPFEAPVAPAGSKPHSSLSPAEIMDIARVREAYSFAPAHGLYQLGSGVHAAARHVSRRVESAPDQR